MKHTLRAALVAAGLTLAITGTAGAAQAPGTIKIGVNQPLTGPVAASVAQAMAAWAHGPVPGRSRGLSSRARAARTARALAVTKILVSVALGKTLRAAWRASLRRSVLSGSSLNFLAVR